MKKVMLASTLITAVMTAGTATGQEVARVEGGSMKVELGYGIVLNSESSLKRKVVVVNDPNVPVVLATTAGVDVKYAEKSRYDRGGFTYEAEFTMEVKEPLSAIEVRFLVFDIWGSEGTPLSATYIADIEPGTMKRSGTWSVYSEHDAEEHFASLGYVARVRTQAGQVKEMTAKYVLDAAREFWKDITLEDLEPEKNGS